MAITKGSRVQACAVIFADEYAVALPGDLGTVVNDDPQFPTVRFDRTGDATVVDPEVEVAEVGHLGFVPLC